MQIARRLVLFLGVTCALGAVLAARPLQFDDLMKLHRVSDPQLSPDGQWVAFTVSDVVWDENRTNSDIWVIPTAGGEPRKLTNSPRADNHARWSPDGRWLAFVSTRDGDSQVWVLPMAGQGGEARKLTSISTGASQPVWSPGGDRLAFVSSVYPEFSSRPFAEADKANREKNEALEKSKVKAKVITQLLYRHWDSWVDGKRKHIFVVDVKDGAAVGEPRNVTPGDNDAVPTSSTFSEGDDFAFSPDGRTLVFAAPHHVTREQAWSTNHDLWSVDLATGERRQLTTNPAADTYPRFSSDGTMLAYRAQARAGFEADKWELRVRSLASGEDWSATKDADVSAGAFTWAPDGRALIFGAQDRGTMAIWSVPSAGGQPQALIRGGYNAGMSVGADKRLMVFTRSDATTPAEVYLHCFDTGVTSSLTQMNRGRLAGVELTPLESVTVAGAGGTPVQMWILRPPGFDAQKQYPLVFWVHGGPQSAFMDVWGYRWNPQLWAAQGYVVALPNPRGSTGFGQKFADEISRDWGGKVFDDLMAALGYLEKQSWIDPSRMAAAGASYGGYMMNWFQGYTDKFRTLVTHCGVYNLTSMYGVTEETWFAEWDTGIPWETPDFEKWSPHRYAANFKTPMLIIHNELDFRVPIGEGLQLFTVLQRKGIPSKLLYFPDEGHWVNKPQNSELWHRTIFEWLEGYLKKG